MILGASGQSRNLFSDSIRAFLLGKPKDEPGRGLCRALSHLATANRISVRSRSTHLKAEMGYGMILKAVA
jgi:hypothetical protein